MKKAILISLIGVLVFLFIFPAFSEIDTSTINYLKAQTPDAWITMALAAAGETELDLNYLKTVSGNSATDYEKAILALTAAGKDPKTFGEIDFVSQLKTFYQSNQIGSSDLLNDDFWGILALGSAGENPSDPIIQNSKTFILTHQNSDGGWSYGVSGQSDTNDTASAVMALLEAGVSPGDPVIAKAVEYLKSNQNNDGGFSYSPGSESDSGSDSWVISAIYKLGQKPEDWQKNNNNPVGHLKSLQRPDGSFKWVASEDKGYPTLTAYAIVALTQNYYPVSRLYNLRIEGGNNNICDAKVKANNALDIIKNGAKVCGYTYLIEETSWGPYLKKINNEEAHDLIGWLYFVNYESPAVGAADYILKPSDQVLWYFGEWGEKPTRLTLSSQKINPDDNLEAKVEYFENSQWKPLASSTISVNNQNFITDNDGKANLIIHNSGAYQVWAEKSGYVRTNQLSLLVGEGSGQDVGLKVEIIPSSSPSPSVPEMGFSISKKQIDFGRLTPGAQTSTQILITNAGNANIYLEGTVQGDRVFRENITLDGSAWPDFKAVLNSGSGKDVLVGLAIPNNWSGFGTKEGDLTFWATANQQ